MQLYKLEPAFILWRVVEIVGVLRLHGHVGVENLVIVESTVRVVLLLMQLVCERREALKTLFAHKVA